MLVDVVRGLLITQCMQIFCRFAILTMKFSFENWKINSLNHSIGPKSNHSFLLSFHSVSQEATRPTYRNSPTVTVSPISPDVLYATPSATFIYDTVCTLETDHKNVIFSCFEYVENTVGDDNLLRFRCKICLSM